MTTFIVLAHSSDQKVQAFGPFHDEGSAERWATLKGKSYPGLDWLAVPISPKSSANSFGRVW